MAAIPRYRPTTLPALLSAGFRPFFLCAAVWSAVAVPIWVAVFAGEYQIGAALSPVVWHVHEMVYGYGGAVVAGFLLTAIPNWTGRMPLQGAPLLVLVLLWGVGRVAVLFSAHYEAGIAALVDLAFPAAFACVVAREIVAGRNWRNLPMLAALTALLIGNLLVHLEAAGIAATAELGNRLGLATLLMLISLVGGRIVPSFTRNWLAKQRPDVPGPASFDTLDRAVLAIVAVALVVWVARPESMAASWIELAAGLAVGLRLVRWRGHATLREPLLWVLHLGYGWLALGFVLLAASGLMALLPPTTALHALTTGAIGTMTLAVMTRASLGHTGRATAAGPRTATIYAMVTLAAVLRLLAPIGASHYLLLLSAAAAAWCAGFAAFVVFYAGPLALPRLKGGPGRLI